MHMFAQYTIKKNIKNDKNWFHSINQTFTKRAAAVLQTH